VLTSSLDSPPWSFACPVPRSAPDVKARHCSRRHRGRLLQPFRFTGRIPRRECWVPCTAGLLGPAPPRSRLGLFFRCIGGPTTGFPVDSFGSLEHCRTSVLPIMQLFPQREELQRQKLALSWSTPTRTWSTAEPLGCC